MKTNKFLVMAAMALGLGVFAACSNDDEPNVPESGKTYVGVSIAFPGAKEGSRALPGDYNSNGEWKGRDEIKSITVYIVNETAGTVDYSTFDKDQFEGITAEGFLKPKLAVKATPGHNIKAYAIINDVNNKTASLKSEGASSFATKFKNLVVEAKASEVAAYSGGKEAVMMTNDKEAASITVKAGVSKEDAIAGTDNQAKINVSRVASRAIVTIAPDIQAKGIQVKNTNGENISKLILKTITYSVGQSNRKFFNMKDADSWKTPDPVYSFIPSTGTPWNTNNANFDYEGIKDYKELQEIADKTNDKVATALQAEGFSKFVLPVTHATGNYRKGNTTYFEVRCTFVPDQIDGEAYNGEPKTVYLGINDGKFYSTREKAQANGQKATQYKDGVMKYVLWLNPNKPYGGAEKITESPTVRNQIYHAHITGFKEIGVPNNPLHPEDPDTPTNPENPSEPDPNNPVNPIDPNDPLQTDDTYMSVSITVLNWGMHSYEVDLGNDY